MKQLIQRYPLAVVMIVSVIMLCTHLGLIQTNIMECRNLISAREMVNDGHWIFTTLNNQPRYEKPPLPTWFTAFFMMMFGMQSMFWLRLPVVLVTLMLVYFFYRFCKQLQLEKNHPLHASLILITSFYIFFAGRDNQWDMYTHAFMIACIFYLFKLFEQTNNRLIYVLLAGLFFGCSFLSKGPVAAYALFLPFLIAYFIVYRKNEGRKLLMTLVVLIIGLLIGFSWPLYVKYFDPYVATALSKQAENWSSYETKPFWYYWSFFTQSGLWTIPSFAALMYLYMLRRVKNVKAYTFSFLWTILSVVLLSLIPEKKARYLLPVLIPMALNTSFYIQYLIDDFKHIKSWFEKTVVYFNFGLIAFIGIAAPVAVYILFKSILSNEVFWYVMFIIICYGCAALILNGLIKKKMAQTFYTTILFMCCIVITAIPLSKLFYNNTAYYPASNIHALEKNNNINTFEADNFEPEIIWNYGNYIPKLDSDVNKIALDNFGLLGDSVSINNLQKKLINYNFKKLARVDLNVLPIKTKGYSSRLAKDYYIVTKRN